MHSFKRIENGLNRRNFIIFTAKSFIFLFFFKGKATAQSQIKVAVVVNEKSNIYSSEDITPSTKICGGDKGQMYLRELGYSNIIRKIPLGEAYPALQMGVCDCIVLASSGSYKIEDLVRDVFRGGFRIVYLKP